MSKNQRYKLLTTCIVAALHPNEQQGTGAVWEPDNTNDTHEAEALERVGYAGKTNEEVTHETASQRQVKAAPADDDEDDVETPLAELLVGNVDEVAEAIDTTELTGEQLKELAKLEAAGKNRKGVHDAIAQYLDGQ